MSSRSPGVNGWGSLRSRTSASSFNGCAVSGRNIMGPVMPGNRVSSTPRSMCAMPSNLVSQGVPRHREPAEVLPAYRNALAGRADVGHVVLLVDHEDERPVERRLGA